MFRSLGLFSANLIIGAAVSLLLVDALDADWTWNPFYDLFFAREQGFIFYEAHGSSILAVLLVAILVSCVESEKSSRIAIAGPVLGVFGIIGIHEIGWYLVGKVLGFDSGIALPFVSVLLALMLVSLAASRKRYLGIWIAQAAFIIPLEFLNPLVLHLPASNIGFVLTDAVYYLPSNAFEVGSWIIPLLFWPPWLYLTFGLKTRSLSSSRSLSTKIFPDPDTRSS